MDFGKERERGRDDGKEGRTHACMHACIYHTITSFFHTTSDCHVVLYFGRTCGFSHLRIDRDRRLISHLLELTTPILGAVLEKADLSLPFLQKLAVHQSKFHQLPQSPTHPLTHSLMLGPTISRNHGGERGRRRKNSSKGEYRFAFVGEEGGEG